MAYTVYADWYVRRNSSRTRELAAAVKRLAGTSLFVLHAEPLGVTCEHLEDLMEPVPQFERLAWCVSKVGHSINPRLAEVVFIVRMKHLAQKLGAECLVHLKGDGTDFGEVRSVTDRKIALRFGLSLLESPIWLVLWVRGFC